MTKEKILAAITGTGGIMSTIADRLELTWSMAYNYCQKYEETKSALADETERILDKAEGTLFSSIDAGDVQSSKWILATKGKKRGYSEKQEMEISGQGQLVIIRGNKPTT